MPTIRKTVGQITLKVLTDVESTTYYYLLVSSMAPAPSAPTTNPPGGGWSTTEPGFFSYVPTQDTVIITGKNYYTRSGSGTEQDPYIYIQVITPVIADIDTYYEKIYGDTKSLYVTVQTLYTDTTFEYSEPSLSSSYEAAKEAYNQAKTALDLAGDTNQYFWTLSSAYSTSVPAGVYVTHIPQSQFKSNPAQGNILMQNTGITIRNGATSLASLSSSALNFYSPTTHNAAMQLSGQALKFYNPNNDNLSLSLDSTGLNFYGSSQSTADVTLDAIGLKLAKGGIEAGTKDSSDYIYVWSDDDSTYHNITINNHQASNWRIIAGNSFGVDKAGSLYASNVDINGKITATSGTIGGWQIGTDNNKSLHNGNANTSPIPAQDTIILSKGITTSNTIGNLPAGTYAITAGTNFGVTTNGVLYASGATIAGNTIITGNTNIASSVTIGDKAQSEYLNTNNNLIWDTEWRNTSNAWSDWGSPTTREIVTLNGKRWLHLVTTTTPFEGYSQNSAKRAGYGEVQAGETVVASFTAYAATEGQRGCIGIHWLNSSGSIVAQSWANFNLETTSKRYVSDVFTVPYINNDNVVGFNVMIGDNSSSACEIWITEVKLEKGNTATNWSLAPQDTNVNQYITNIDNQRGITIKPVNSSGNDYLQINSTDIRFIRNNYAKTVITDGKITLYGGNATYPLVDIDSSAIKIAQSANNYANVNSNGLTVFANLDPDGDNIYTATQVASFGAEATIGIVNDNFSNIHITSDSMTISNKGVETYKIENATDREVKVKIDLNHSFQSGDTSFSLDIELGRTVSSWINTGGVRGIVLTYDLWGDDYGDISQSYNGPTVIDTEGKYAFTSELNGSVMTITFGPGATLDDEIIYFTSVEFNFIAADPVVHNTIGAYANNTLSSPFKIGVGTASIPSNAMLVDFSGNTKIKGDLFIKCNDDSTGGMPLGTVREYTQSSRPSGLRYLYIDAFQVGYTVTLVIEFQMATSTASVGNYFTQILQEIPAPAHQHMRISGFGYTGGAIVGYWLAWTDGFWQLSARNLSGTTTGSSFGLTASLTYVTDGTLCWDNY